MVPEADGTFSLLSKEERTGGDDSRGWQGMDLLNRPAAK